MEKLERLRREHEALAGSYADLKEGLERLKAREERRDPEARARESPTSCARLSNHVDMEREHVATLFALLLGAYLLLKEAYET